MTDVSEKRSVSGSPNVACGLLGPCPTFEQRVFRDFACLAEKVAIARQLGYRLVLTQGVYDLLHGGHARYLRAAKSYGDILIVGVDSDEKTKARKGPSRPIVPEDERVEMLLHTAYVDVVAIKELREERWSLIRVVRPDVLIVSKSTKDFSAEELAALQEFCGEVVVLPPQASTSTTARLRRYHIDGAGKIVEDLVSEVVRKFPIIAQEYLERLRGEKE